MKKLPKEYLILYTDTVFLLNMCSIVVGIKSTPVYL